MCKNNGLKIFADGGTLLGAVRHKGFIPWDDDIDFSMQREDFDKLVKIGPKLFKEPYFFQSFETDNFWGGMIKLRRSDTAMIESGYKYHKEFNRGIFIDVFVLDAIPLNKFKFIMEYNIIKIVRRSLYLNRLFDVNKIHSIRRYIYMAINFSVKLLGDRFLNNALNKLLSSNNIRENKEIALLDFHALIKHNIKQIKRRNKVWYEDVVYLPFNNIYVPVPSSYHEVLTSLYGDYMTPVVGGALHQNEIVDCHNSYKNYL